MTTHVFGLERVPTPVGLMLICTDEQGFLRAVDWEDHEARMHRLFRQQYKGVDICLSPGRGPSKARLALEAYFEGGLRAIETLNVATGGTEFQRQVWRALRDIPAGETSSYAALAARIGRPNAVRAVGSANGANPIGVVVPCHRVIGTDSSLTGYGGGLPRKHWLLTHEGVALRPGMRSARGGSHV